MDARLRADFAAAIKDRNQEKAPEERSGALSSLT
jgi:hypothetical protein